MQLVFYWARKLARKCESKHWFPCGAVTWLPNFLGWVDYYISLAMGLRPRLGTVAKVFKNWGKRENGRHPGAVSRIGKKKEQWQRFYTCPLFLSRETSWLIDWSLCWQSVLHYAYFAKNMWWEHETTHTSYFRYRTQLIMFLKSRWVETNSRNIHPCGQILVNDHLP